MQNVFQTVIAGDRFSSHISCHPDDDIRYPRGTVGHIYLTSDGGANLTTLYSLVAQLEPHVEVVNQNAIVEMAIQRG